VCAQTRASALPLRADSDTLTGLAEKHLCAKAAVAVIAVATEDAFSSHDTSSDIDGASSFC